MKRRQKSWIFVSHSTQDIDDVRRVRDEIESRGGEPLLFFLKCVSDADELDKLLKREIKARRYFLLCDSNNAKSSRWVKQEVKYVRRLKGKQVETLDLSWQWARQAAVIRRLLKTSTLFPCYARQDRSTVEPLLNALKSHEFGLYDAFDREGPVDELGSEINSAIDDSRYLLDFLSDNSVRSEWCRVEVNYFASDPKNREHYIPVVLERSLAVERVLARLSVKSIDFSDRNVERFVIALEARLY